jgi:hypothetical protein
VNVLPYIYANILRWVSPLFTLAEGISTLLVIQVVGKVGKGWADEEEKEEGIEWRQLLGLVAAALVYCAGLAGVIMVSYKGEGGADETGIPKWTSIIYSSFHARCGTYYCPLLIPHRVYTASDKRTGNEFGLCLRRGKLHYQLNHRLQLTSSTRPGYPESKQRWSK